MPSVQPYNIGKYLWIWSLGFLKIAMAIGTVAQYGVATIVSSGIYVTIHDAISHSMHWTDCMHEESTELQALSMSGSKSSYIGTWLFLDTYTQGWIQKFCKGGGSALARPTTTSANHSLAL